MPPYVFFINRFGACVRRVCICVACRSSSKKRRSRGGGGDDEAKDKSERRELKEKRRKARSRLEKKKDGAETVGRPALLFSAAVVALFSRLVKNENAYESVWP